MNPITESLLVFSDVHLGSDLNDSGPKVSRSRSIDDDLCALLAHYRTVPPSGDRWRLVIAGDFVDFVGMAIDPRIGDDLVTTPSAEDLAVGLGGAEDHGRLKLQRAVERHPAIFRELAGFVSDGNALTFITGNHDLEMYWETVQRDFCALLTREGTSLDEVTARVEFEPWFFYREGIAYVEHGHQYDPFCATPYLFAPLSPTDPARVLQSLSDTLLRYVVRRTPGMKEYGHESRGLTSYITWGLMLGARGTAALFGRFIAAITLLHEIARAYSGAVGAQVRAQHESALAERARATGLSEEKLRQALALHVTPLGATPRGVLASVMLDRLLVAAVMVLALAAVAVARPWMGGYALHAVVVLLVMWVIAHVVLSRGRPNVDPAALMCTRASELAKLFPASFVVMGHTHVPMRKTLEETTYFNLGSWAEEEPDPNEDMTKAYRAARTHLVVHSTPVGNEAQLCEWLSREGPRPLGAPVIVDAAARAEPRGIAVPPVGA